MNDDRRALTATLLMLPFVTSAPRARGRVFGPERLDPDRIGINTHIAQGEQPVRVVEALRFLGVQHIRDAVPTPGTMGRFMTVLRGPARLTAVANGVPLAIVIDALEAVERAQPGAVAAVEGPNEINNFPIRYKGLAGVEAGAAYQNDLYDAVHASPVLAHVAVLAFTDIRFQDVKSDVFNVHIYPPAGSSLQSSLPRLRERVARSADSSKPLQITEFGYSTAQVTEAQQAELVTDGLSDAVAGGIARTFVYSLSDFYLDRTPDQHKLDCHFGLFDIAYRPKPAARALARLLRV